MLNYARWLKVSYLLALVTALVLLLSKTDHAQAQRSIAYPFLPGAGVNAAAMSAVAANSTPLNSYNQAASVLSQAQQALDPFGVGQSGGMGLLGGMGMGGTGVGGGLTGQGAAGGGMVGISGFGGGNLGGVGGAGGFAGKGFGGFNGKKAL